MNHLDTELYILMWFHQASFFNPSSFSRHISVLMKGFVPPQFGANSTLTISTRSNPPQFMKPAAHPSDNMHKIRLDQQRGL